MMRDAVIDAIAQRRWPKIGGAGFRAAIDMAAEWLPVVEPVVREAVAEEVRAMNSKECELAFDIEKALDFHVKHGLIELVLEEALPLLANEIERGSVSHGKA